MYLRSPKDDSEYINMTKKAFFDILNRLTKKADGEYPGQSNPDTAHDGFTGYSPTTENLLSGQRMLNRNKMNRMPGESRILNTKERERNFDGEVGQNGDSAVNRTQGGEVGHGEFGPSETPKPFKGDAVNSISDLVGGKEEMNNEQMETSINPSTDSLGPDTAKTTEGQFPTDDIGRDKVVVRKGQPHPTSEFTPSVIRKKKGK
jgi:hypothetical protein